MASAVPHYASMSTRLQLLRYDLNFPTTSWSRVAVIYCLTLKAFTTTSFGCLPVGSSVNSE